MRVPGPHVCNAGDRTCALQRNRPMRRKTTILFLAAQRGTPPVATSAKTMDLSVREAGGSASLTIRKAGEAAFQAYAGTLAAMVSGGENGRAACGAVVIVRDRQLSTVRTDAGTGQAFASALSSSMDDTEGQGDEDPGGKIHG